MITQFNEAEALAYCNQLTKNDETLIIKWDGGNDSGYFQVFLDDKELDPTDEQVERLIMFVDTRIGYGSFAGDFWTQGEVEFKKYESRFYGIDTLCKTETETNNCEIEIYLPNDIWFDELRLQIYHQGFKAETINAELVVNNGPFTDYHRQLAENVMEDFKAKVASFIECHHENISVWYEQQIPLDNFTKIKNRLCHTIKELIIEVERGNEEEIIINLK